MVLKPLSLQGSSLKNLKNWYPLLLSKKRLYDEKKRKFKWHGFGDPNRSDIKTNELWKDEGGILQGKWVHPEKYNAHNLPPWSKNKSPKEKAKMIKDLNSMLYDERKRQEDLLKDLNAIRKETKDIRLENPDLHGNFEDLSKLITRLIKKSCVSYPNGKKTSKCVHWWFNGVLPGKDILESFEN